VQLGGELDTVAPAPMIATCSWSGRNGCVCVCARMYALTSRRWNRSASTGSSSAIAYSCAPGVPKSLVRLPMQMTSVS
jgi:hypothetical protein